MNKAFNGWRIHDPIPIHIDDDAVVALVMLAGFDPDARRDSRRARKLLDCVREALDDCLAKERAIRKGPKRAHRLEGLRVLLKAQRKLVKAIEILDGWTWWHLLDEGWLDTEICQLPKDDGEPVVPLAVAELGQAAERYRAHLLKQGSKTKRDTFRSEVYRDEAIVRLARVFHEHAAPTLRDAHEYRRKLLQFVLCALGVARRALPGSFREPEDRKMLRRIPKNYQGPRVSGGETNGLKSQSTVPNRRGRIA